MTPGANLSSRLWRGLLVAAAIAASIRSLIPVGYMPSVAGGRIALIECRGYVLVNESAAGAHHHHAGAASMDESKGRRSHDGRQRMQSCPFAVAGHFALETPAPAIEPAMLWATPDFALRNFRFNSHESLTPAARGPPFFS